MPHCNTNFLDSCITFESDHESIVISEQCTEVDFETEEDLRKEQTKNVLPNLSIFGEFQTNAIESIKCSANSTVLDFETEVDTIASRDNLTQIEWNTTSDHEMINSNNSTGKNDIKDVDFVQCGFKTGNNKKIKIDEKAFEREKKRFDEICEYDEMLKHEDIKEKSSLDRKLACEDQQCVLIEKDNLNEETKVEISKEGSFIGFKTGKNKKIGRTAIVKENGRYTVEISKNQPRGTTIRKYNCPQKGHITQKLKKNIRMMELYDKLVDLFGDKYTMEQIGMQFKWAWMHFVVNPLEYIDIEEKIVDLVKHKLENECSYCKKVCEKHISSYKYCVFGILEVKKDELILFDGFYEFPVQMDVRTKETLKKAEMGNKIHVFGMEYLYNEETNKHVFTLKFNNWRECNTKTAIGYKQKASFFTQIKHIQIGCGIVPALRIKIVRVVEEGHSLKVGNYKALTTNIEAEMEKVYDLAKKAHKEIKKEEVHVQKYAKLIVTDGTEDCLLTWWNAPDVKGKDVFDMVCLDMDNKSEGVHLIATFKTYYKIVKTI